MALRHTLSHVQYTLPLARVSSSAARAEVRRESDRGAVLAAWTKLLCVWSGPA